MLKAGLIGLGGMGKGHLDNYMRFKKDNAGIDLAAVCDINEKQFSNIKIQINIGEQGSEQVDYSALRCYTDAEEMIAKEEIDLVSIALPTYLHCEYTVKCLNRGIHVFCEKPMALDPGQCDEMLEASYKNNKKLMIGQCLRFWGEYEFLKDIVSSGKFGKPIASYMYRGGELPGWTYNNWMLKRECGGGALLDQHVHDADMINYLFGLPRAVCTVAKVVVPGSGYDTVSTNYIYDDMMAVNAQDDWAIAGKGFSMSFRVNFEGGTVIMDSGGFRIAESGGDWVPAKYTGGNAYAKEILYFADCIVNNKANTINPPESSRDTMRIIRAELESADRGGAVVEVR